MIAYEFHRFARFGPALDQEIVMATDDDQARMIAFDLKENTVEAYAAEYREAYNKKHADKGEGDREFRAMQRAKQLDQRPLV